MGTFERVAVIIAATGLVTALVLPGRQTAAVVDAGGRVFTGALRAAQGR
jgi:hypothetical protein